MSQWHPHATVATVVLRDNHYLIVEERDKADDRMVFNQPAGHLEPGESLAAGAVRETLEETGWLVRPVGLLGVSLYTAPATAISYLRATFLAEPLRHNPDQPLDSDISAVHWLDYPALLADSARMRSPLVLAAIERQRSGIIYPLDVLFDP